MRRGHERELHNLRVVGHTTVGASGDGMHVNLKDGYAYFGHQTSGGTSVIDVRDPQHPTVVGNLPAPPNTHSHKVQVCGDVLLVNRERMPDRTGGTFAAPWTAGLSVFDISDARHPREIGFWSCGGRGVHRMAYWTEPYAYVTAGGADVDDQFLVILDLSDPSRPVEAGRWWYPGMHRTERDRRTWPPGRTAKLHHAVPGAPNRLYCGWWDLGLVILDTTDVTAPKLVSRLDLDEADAPSQYTHTAAPVPGRDLLVVTDETILGDRCNIHDDQGPLFHARMVDISDERSPRVLGRFPEVEDEYCHCVRGGRLGPHNVHETRPGSFHSDRLVFMTHFNGGLRVYDVADPSAPREVARFVPEAPYTRSSGQINDVYVDEDGLIYTTERYGGGLYILELDDDALDG